MNNLTNERVKANLSQKELAKLVGTTKQHISRLEAGTSDGSIKIWKKIALLFNESLDYMLRFEQNTLKK